MTQSEHITYKVWLEIGEHDEVTGDGRTLDAPGTELAGFDTYDEACAFASTLARVASDTLATGIAAHTPDRANRINANMPVTMSEDEFDATYGSRLRTNHLNPDASWAYGDGPGCLFAPAGEELEFVCRQDPATIWTLIDGDDGRQYLISGFHAINRVGYLCCVDPVPGDTHIEVVIDPV